MPHDDFEAQRDALIEEIRAAFAGVELGDGVSWNQSAKIDLYCYPHEIAAARATDAHRPWIGYARDRTWCVGPGVGGFTFLDALGYRHYLPAAMIRCLTDPEADNSCGSMPYHLTLGEPPEYQLDQWSLLDERQRRCTARFVRWMATIEPEGEWAGHNVEDWVTAYKSYWNQHVD